MSPAPGWTTGRINGALSFDGVDDTVSCGSGGALGTLSAITVSTWVNLASVGEGGFGRIVQKGNGANPTAGWRLVSQGTNQIEFSVDYAGADVGRVSTANAFMTGTWAHVVATWAGSTAGSDIKLFVNGVEVSYTTTSNGSGTRNSDTSVPLRIGNNDLGSSTVNGKIDEVRVYDRVLSLSEIQALAAGSPVGYWKLDDASGTSAQDGSGNANNCTLSPVPTWTAGRVNGALSFDGVDDTVNCGSGGTLGTLSSMTVSAWVNLVSMGEGGFGRIVQKGNGANPTAGWRLVSQGTDQLEFSVDYATTDVGRVSATGLLASNTNTWVHVAATWAGSTTATDIKLYVNGTETPTYTSTLNGSGTRNSDTAVPLRIGNNDLGSSTVNGKIDDVRVYNRVLSASEILVLADSTAPAAPSTPTATPISSSQIDLSWPAATDNVGVTGYRIERCQGSGCTTFAQVGTSTGVTFSDSGLTASTLYRYRVRSVDANTNISATYSPIVNGTTLSGGGGDTQPPTAPTNLSATVVSSSMVHLAWDASTDNVGVTGYRIERCSGAGCSSFSLAGTSGVTTFDDSTVSPSTTYVYQVRATDAALLQSAPSAPATATIAVAMSVGQAAYAVPATATTVTAAFPGSQAAGKTNVIAIGWKTPGATVQSVTDTAGNSYMLAVGPTILPGVGGLAIYYASGTIASGAGNTVSVTFNMSVASPDVRIAEYTGIDTGDPIDAIASNTGTGTTSSSGTVTTVTPNTLIVGANLVTSTTTGPGSGFITRALSSPNGNILEDRIVSGASTYSATAPLSASGQWIMQLVAFRWIGSLPCN